MSSVETTTSNKKKLNAKVYVYYRHTRNLNSSARQLSTMYAPLAGSDVKNGSSYNAESPPIPALMWTLDYCGLYAQYAAVGLVTGSMGITYNFCVYYYDGSSNLCANAKNIQMLAWSFKIIYAVFTDLWRPFGCRRRPFIIAGWFLAIVLMAFLAAFADSFDASGWILMLFGVNAFMLLADVPADGYAVELGRMETGEQRGQVVATAQMIRWIFATFAGVIQALLMNGPHTNKDDCTISWNQCWGWGLTVSGFYWFLTVLLIILFVPMCYLKEPDAKYIPEHSIYEFFDKIWETMQNQTTFRLIVFVIGIHAFTNFISNAAIYLQYYVIGLTNFQSGIDSISTSLATAMGIRLFQTHLMKYNWRYTSYLSSLLTAAFSLLWILAFHNILGLRNGNFTIFIDVDQNFTEGMAKVLYSLTVLELAQPGLEATTFELITSVSNAGMSLSTILATQLLTPMKANSCTDDDDSNDDGACTSSKDVNISNEQSFEDSGGPMKFTYYTLLLSKCYNPLRYPTLSDIIGFLIQLVFLSSRASFLHPSCQGMWRNARRGKMRATGQARALSELRRRSVYVQH